MTYETMAQLCLKVANGGRLNASEQSFTEESVSLLIQMWANTFMRRDIDAKEGREEPDDVYYHERVLDILWDDTRKWCYALFTSGDPVGTIDDLGVWVYPISGDAKFERARQGWCADNARLAWCEGRFVWELRPGKIIFPTMPKGFVAQVGALVIETGIVNIEEEIAAPAGHLSSIQMEVLKIMGYYPRDLYANLTPDQGRAQR